MKLKDILAISGKSGLYKFISQGRNGIIVESFDDNSRTAISASTKVSALEDIAIFTETEEVPLAEVFRKIYRKEDGKQAIDSKKSPEELKKYFESVLPEYDREKVYVSDMKKVVQWYNSLNVLKLIDLEKDKADADKNDESSEKKEPEKSLEKDAKKPAAKNKPVAKQKTFAPKAPAVAKRTNQTPKKGA